jgi:hypothetical protein
MLKRSINVLDEAINVPVLELSKTWRISQEGATRK